MRVVTLLPAATEIVARLGAGPSLVGISHECDYPPEVTHLPRVTSTPVDPGGPGAAIDAEVRRLRAAGVPVITVDAGQIRRLAPDLILTQGLCEVCAVSDGTVHRLAEVLSPAPAVLSLRAATVAGILEDIRRVGRTLDLMPAAESLAAELASRLAGLGRTPRPSRRRVLCLEWLDPLYLAGHWVPELVAAAGGEDVGAAPGSHSRPTAWSRAAGLGAEVVAVMLCGFGVERAARELDAVTDPAGRRLLEELPVWILDGNAYTSRPGPRVVEGAERLRAMLEERETEGLRQWTPWSSRLEPAEG